MGWDKRKKLTYLLLTPLSFPLLHVVLVYWKAKLVSPVIRFGTILEYTEQRCRCKRIPTSGHQSESVLGEVLSTEPLVV